MRDAARKQTLKQIRSTIAAYDRIVRRYPTSGYADSGPGRLVQRNNVFVGSGPCEAGGSVVEPRTFYAYTLDAAATVPGLVASGAGAGAGVGVWA